jgi:hypothetical protein
VHCNKIIHHKPKKCTFSKLKIKNVEHVHFFGLCCISKDCLKNRRTKFGAIIKDKAVPLQDLRLPEGFRRLRLPDFKTIDT